MSDFAVVVAPVAADKIGEYGRYIAEKSGSVEVAERWVDRLYEAIETLAVFPRRFGLAEEDTQRDYEVRRLIFGDYLALYTIDDVQKTVKVVGFRHGSRQPRAHELPDNPS